MSNCFPTDPAQAIDSLKLYIADKEKRKVMCEKMLAKIEENQS